MRIRLGHYFSKAWQTVSLPQRCHALPIHTLAFHSPGSWRGSEQGFGVASPTRWCLLTKETQSEPRLLSADTSVQETKVESPTAMVRAEPLGMERVLVQHPFVGWGQNQDLNPDSSHA